MAFLSFPSPTQLRNLTDPSSSQDAATKAYVDAALSSGSGTLSVGNISATGNIIAGGDITSNYFIGNGSQLTGITASSITGQVANANYAAYAGNVTISSQPNITSIGTLTSLAVTGSVNLGTISNVKISGGTANYVLATDGSGNLTWAAPNIPSTLTADVDSFTGDGSTVLFSLANAPAGENFTMVAVQGVLQPKTTYSLNGRVLTFDSAPPNTSIIEVTTFGGSVMSGGGDSSAPAFAWNIASSNATMSANNGYFVDTSNAAKTMTLPSSPTLGDTIRINDLAGTFSTNNLTVARNGQKIQGIAQDLLVDTDQTSFGLVFSNSTYGWKVLEL